MADNRRELAEEVLDDLRAGHIAGLKRRAAEAEEKVARLEAAIRAKDAALQDGASLLTDYVLGSTCNACTHRSCMDKRKTLADMHAALSPTAGEGWLPPNRVEQVRPQGAKAFIQWAQANKSRIHRDALDEAAMGYSAGWDAALDALGEK